jgi:hypothetical protein
VISKIEGDGANRVMDAQDFKFDGLQSQSAKLAVSLRDIPSER